MATDFHTPASILETLTPETLPAHLEKLKAHLAQRMVAKNAGTGNASNTKVINRLNREIAHLTKV